MLKYFIKFAGSFLCLILSSIAVSAPSDIGIDYDVVYVRYPAVDATDDFVTISQGEDAYVVAPGADLMLLHPDGSEEVLVDCTTCSVIDPFISFDARWVYYARVDNITDGGKASGGFIYKIDLQATAPRPEIQLTFNDGFESLQYAGNNTAAHDQAAHREIRDMAPFPLADGRIGFTSNRAALTAFQPRTVGTINAVVSGSVQQMYVIDDHDGSKNTAALSNLHRIETGTLHLAQHPMQLKDGRILFTTWQDVALKFSYAMSPLFTIHPDGSNMQQFTEPHDHHKTVDHFITQLPNEAVVWGNYYPSFDYGFGELLRAPISSAGPDYLRGPITDDEVFAGGFKVSYREFDRKGMVNMTPHTDGSDTPAPGLSGKYSMPSATKNNGMLVAYSSGSVNHFSSRCAPDNCEALKSGIYLINDAENALITDPKQLKLVKDDKNFNEIWPRAVVPYSSIYGINKPLILPSLANNTADNRLDPGEAAAIVGTSSMYNMDPSDRKDVFQSNSNRELHDGNWTIQGAEAGIFTNEDIYAVRIVGTPAKVFTKPIRRYGGDSTEYERIKRYLKDNRLDDVVARYGSLHNERWEILGEFPLTHRGSIDGQGNPDSSWMAKVPAETPFLIQTLDKNGMTIVSELTWRALKSGENRTDCGGCHAHSVEPLEFSTTKAGNAAPIVNVPGVENDDSRISGGMWDLTSGSIPLLTDKGVAFENINVLDVEFNRDIVPILNSDCVACHTSNTNNGGLILDGAYPNDAWAALTNKAREDGSSYIEPQRSKYIRVPQARESLLTWIAYEKRLDGRSNDSRSDDVDYPDAHPKLNLAENKRRTIARWIDLGSPIDFPDTKGFGYTNDNQLPVINVFMPMRGNSPNNNWEIGVIDAKSGLDLNTLSVSYAQLTDGVLGDWITLAIDPSQINSKGVVSIPSPAETDKVYVIEVSIRDLAGNLSIDKRKVTFSPKRHPPSPPLLFESRPIQNPSP